MAHRILEIGTGVHGTPHISARLALVDVGSAVIQVVAFDMAQFVKVVAAGI
jgi:hypothetical protein